MAPSSYPGLRTRRDSDVVVFCGDTCERSGGAAEIASRVPAAAAAAPEDGGTAASAPQPPAADGAPPPLLPEDAEDLFWEPAHRVASLRGALFGLDVRQRTGVAASVASGRDHGRRRERCDVNAGTSATSNTMTLDGDVETGVHFKHVRRARPRLPRPVPEPRGAPRAPAAAGVLHTWLSVHA